MGAFVWGVAVVAAVCLLQAPVAHWLARYFEQDQPDVDVPADLPADMDAYDRSPGVCPGCGTQNDATFRYCAHCASPLWRVPDP